MKDPNTQQIQLRVPPALREAVQASATANERSLAGEIRHALREYLRDQPRRSSEPLDLFPTGIDRDIPGSSGESP